MKRAEILHGKVQRECNVFLHKLKKAAKYHSIRREIQYSIARHRKKSIELKKRFSSEAEIFFQKRI